MMVADSDVLIHALHGREPSRGRIARELKAGTLATTAVNVFELMSGARNDRQRQLVDELVQGLVILPFDQDAARLAAKVRLELEAQGLGIGMADYLIAGVCLSRSAMLLTRNRAHFERVPELALSALTGAVRGAPHRREPGGRTEFMDGAERSLAAQLGVIVRLIRLGVRTTRF